MSRARVITAVAGGLGAVAAGAVAGVLAERKAVRAARSRPDAVADEPFGRLPADRTKVVVASDGVELHVEETGSQDAAVTVVFCHGWTLEMAMWHFQRQGLTDVGRLVFYDHRAHGRSGACTAANSTITQVGRDLESVLEECVPEGPVVLVGHSMGGMAIMALALRRPELFRAEGRIAGVALMCTSAGLISQAVLGLPARVSARVLGTAPRALLGLSRASAFVDARREGGVGRDFNHAFTRRMSFGTTDVPPSVVDLMERMITATPVDVIAAFLPAVLDHRALDALPVLREIPVLILAGARDLITPAGQSEAMHRKLPTSELVVLPDAGHMAMLERPALVNVHLRALVSRSLHRAAGVA